MTFKADFVDPTNAFTVFEQSAEPDDLAARVQAAMRANAGPGGPGALMVYDLQLAGAGAGHTFVALMSFAPGGDITGGAPIDPREAIIVGYAAANMTALPAQRAAALAAAAGALGGLMQVDEPLAGASDGTRFLGLAVFST